MNVFPNRFMPAPYPVRQTEQGPIIPEPSDVRPNDKFMSLWQRLATTERCTPAAAKKFIEVPYDLYCPTVDLKSRICSICSLYRLPMPQFVGIKSRAKEYRKNSRMKHQRIHLIQEDVEDVHHVDTLPDAAPIYRNIFDILSSPWQDL